MQEVKRTLAHVATLLRDIRRSSTLPPDLEQRTADMQRIIIATGHHILNQEYPQADSYRER